MSDKLISANALAQGVKNWGKIKGREGASDVFLYAINNAPAVDAVEVVRCGKCEYWKRRFVNSKGFVICPASGMEITEDDFCSYGERREDNAVD